MDAIVILAVLGFFAAAAGYTHFCDRVVAGSEPTGKDREPDRP